MTLLNYEFCGLAQYLMLDVALLFTSGPAEYLSRLEYVAIYINIDTGSMFDGCLGSIHHNLVTFMTCLHDTELVYHK